MLEQTLGERGWVHELILEICLPYLFILCASLTAARDGQQFTLTFTPTVNLMCPSNLTPICMSLGCGRKLEHFRETHTDTGRTCKLHSPLFPPLSALVLFVSQQDYAKQISMQLGGSMGHGPRKNPLIMI